ncbi:hypothetical protein D3C87_378440 [compost metagenome]
MTRNIAVYAGLASLFITGIALFVFGITINGRTMDVIENTSIAVASGESIQQFITPIMGVIAKGYITNVPPIIAKTSVVTGLLITYFCIYFVMCRRSNLPLKSLFTKAYWTDFNVLMKSKSQPKKKARR